MSTVHVFISSGRFRSFAEMRSYIDMTYTEDGDGVPSAFIREVELSGYEPACIEAIRASSTGPVRLGELLARASYSHQWLSRLDTSRLADAAICLFSPNRPARPDGCSLEYIGAFAYRVACPEPFA